MISACHNQFRPNVESDGRNKIYQAHDRYNFPSTQRFQFPIHVVDLMQTLVSRKSIFLLWSLEENNSEINLVRYTTSEIDSLFKEVNYNLKDVRDTK